MSAAAEDQARLLPPDAGMEDSSKKPDSPRAQTEVTDHSPKAGAARTSDTHSPPQDGCEDSRGQVAGQDGSPNKAEGDQGGPEDTGNARRDSAQDEERLLTWQSKDASLTPTIASRLYHWYHTKPNRRAFVFITEGRTPSEKGKVIEQSVTRRQVYTLAARCAHFLITTHSLRPRTVVINTLPCSLECLLLDLAVVLAGAIPLDLPRREETLSRFCRCLTTLDVSLVLCGRTDPFATKFINSMPLLSTNVCWISYLGDCNDNSHLLGTLANASAQELAEAERTLHDVQAEDRAVIWTTRGRGNAGPRAVAHDHSSVLNIGLQLQNYALQLDKTDVYFSGASCSGLFGFPAVYLITGVTTVFEDRTPYPSCWFLGPQDSARLRPFLSFSAILGQNCTKAFFPTLLLDRYLDGCTITIHKGRKLKRMVVSGDQVKTALVRQLLRHVAREVLVVYCLTEVGMVAHSEHPARLFKESDLLTIVDTVTLHARAVPDGDLLLDGEAGTLQIHSKPTVQLLEEPLLDSTGETTFNFREVDLMHTDDLGVIFEGQLKLAGRMDHDLLLPNMPLFIRERAQFQLRLLEHVADAVLLVYQSDGTDVSGKSLVACLTVDVQENDANPELLAVRARYECECQAEQMQYWKPDEYWVFGVFPKTVSGAIDRQRLRALVDRARRQRLPFDWHYRQCQGALRVVKPKRRQCACCCIL